MSPPSFATLEIIVGAPLGAGRTMLIRGDGGEASAMLVSPTSDPDVVLALQRLRRLDADAVSLALLGRALFNALLQGEARDVYRTTQGALKDGQRLRLVLTIPPDAPELVALPWELLHDPSHGPLALRGVSVVRYLPQLTRRPTLHADLPLRVLLTAAQTPPPVDVRRELQVVERALAGLASSVQVTVVPHLTAAALQGQLRAGFDVWHFVGHGGLEGDGSGSLVLEDEVGDPLPTGADALAALVAGSGVKLVVLDACGGAEIVTDPLRSLAPALVAAGVPAVVAQQFPTFEETSRTFAAAFYAALADGSPIDACVTEGRARLLTTAGASRPDWAIPVVYTRALDGRLFSLPSPAHVHTAPADRARQTMIARVRADWIDGYLKQSLGQGARVRVDLTPDAAAVAQPWGRFVMREGRPQQALVSGTTVADVFDEHGGALLILGAPGSGKTVALLELASDLLNRAERDASLPMPVVFHLASWAARRRPLADWLVDELAERYDVPRAVGRDWVMREQVLPLLDGLDEVAAPQRAACVAAINAFREAYGLLPIAVCSRAADYREIGVQLRLRAAVALQPLTRAQVDAALDDEPALRAALDDDPALRELAESPLLLNVMRLAYAGLGHAELSRPAGADERRRQLFDAYIEHMFSRRGAPRYPRERAIRWLAWLARAMARESQSIFRIERLQPEWLGDPELLRRYRTRESVGIGAVTGLAIGAGVWAAILLTVATVFGAIWVIPDLPPEVADLSREIFAGLPRAAAVMLLLLPFGAIISGLGGLIAGLVQPAAPDRTGGAPGVGGRIALAAALAPAALAGATGALAIGGGPVGGLALGLAVAVAVTLVGVAPGWLGAQIGVWRAPHTPNARSAALRGLGAAVGVGAGGGLAAALMVAIVSDPSAAVAVGLAVAAPTALASILGAVPAALAAPPASRLSRGEPSAVAGLRAGLRPAVAIGLLCMLFTGAAYGAREGVAAGLGSGLLMGLLAWALAATVAAAVCGVGGAIARRVGASDAPRHARMAVRTAMTVGLGFTLAMLPVGIMMGAAGLPGMLEQGGGPWSEEAIRAIGLAFFAPAVALVVGQLAALITGLLLALAPRDATIEPVERLRWSWARGRIGLAAGVAVGAIYGGAAGVFGGAGGLVGNWLLIALAGLLVGGLSRGALEQTARPNEGVWRSLRTALTIGPIAMFAAGVLVTLTTTLAVASATFAGGSLVERVRSLLLGFTSGVVAGVPSGLTVGVALGLVYGGLTVTQHVALRWVLWRSGLAPWSYVRFLDDAVDRLLMRRVGGSYIFAHRLLMEHIAELTPAPAPELPAVAAPATPPMVRPGRAALVSAALLVLPALLALVSAPALVTSLAGDAREPEPLVRARVDLPAGSVITETELFFEIVLVPRGERPPDGFDDAGELYGVRTTRGIFAGDALREGDLERDGVPAPSPLREEAQNRRLLAVGGVVAAALALETLALAALGGAVIARRLWRRAWARGLALALAGVIALACVAGVWSSALRPPPATGVLPTEVALVDIVVARVDLPAGVALTDALLTYSAIPVTEYEAGQHFTRLGDIDGAVTTRPIFASEPVRRGALALVGPSAAPQLPAGAASPPPAPALALLALALLAPLLALASYGLAALTALAGRDRAS